MEIAITAVVALVSIVAIVFKGTSKPIQITAEVSIIDKRQAIKDRLRKMGGISHDDFTNIHSFRGLAK
jgi:hypothetical protein